MVEAAICPQAQNTRRRTAGCGDRTHGLLWRILSNGTIACFASFGARQYTRYVELCFPNVLLNYNVIPVANISPFPHTGFIACNSHIPISDKALAEPYDWQYCRYLAERHGVISIPAAPFFSRDDYSAHYRVPSLARFAFCKRDETLIEATRRLRAAPQDYVAPSTTPT